MGKQKSDRGWQKRRETRPKPALRPERLARRLVRDGLATPVILQSKFTPTKED